MPKRRDRYDTVVDGLLAQLEEAGSVLVQTPDLIEDWDEAKHKLLCARLFDRLARTPYWVRSIFDERVAIIRLGRNR